MRECPVCRAEVPELAGSCPGCRKPLSDDPVWKVVFHSDASLRHHYDLTLVHHGLVVPRPRAEELEAHLRLHIVLPDARGDLWLVGRVVGVHERPERHQAPYDIQLELIDMEAEHLERLRPETPTPRAGSHAPPEAAASPPPEAPRDRELDAFIDGLLERQRSFPPEETERRHARPAPEPTARARLPKELAKELTDFTIQFVRAVTKASYYTAEHQEAGKAKLGIYRAFTALAGGRAEVTFYARRAGERFTLLVYGIFEEPADLAHAMMPGQAELYIPKLAQYFESNAIVSLSFKPSLSEEEFHSFVDVLASPAGSSGIVERLAALRIHNISVVVSEDVVRAHGLSWRVEMALTRLKKDLSVIPLYEHLSEEQLAQVRLQVFQDVLRPLRHVDLIRELLENCDRIVEEVEEFTEQQLAEIEAQVLASVPDELLPPLLEGFAEDIGTAKTERSAELDRLLRLARRVVGQLRPEQAKSLEAAFRKLLAEQVLELEDLPRLVREKFKIERDANYFSQLRERILEHFDREVEPQRYQALLAYFESIFAELLARSDPTPALAMVDRVAAHVEIPPSFAERPDLAQAWFERVIHGPVTRHLPVQLTNADKVKREGLFELCRRLGDEIVPTLIASVSVCPQASTRQAIGAVLAELKHASLPHLRRALTRDDLPTEARIELMRVLGSVGDSDDAALLEGLLSHESPLVRIEALATASQLVPHLGESHALAALGAEDARLRDVALGLLLERHCAAPELFAFCRRSLEAPDDDDPSLARRICSGLGGYPEGDGRDHAITVLRSLVVDACGQRAGLWSSLKRSVNRDRGQDQRLAAACHALAKLRAVEAREALEDLARHGSPALARAAHHALELLDAEPEGAV